jgi:transcriptional regulator with XRE-family HTH domain
MLGDMPRTPQSKPGGAVMAEIYAKRQVRRPHYLAKLMARQQVSRATLVEELGVDKSQISRWLDEEKPQTPSPPWAEKLGRYFAASDDPDDFVDIFSDPDLARFQRMTRGMSDAEVDRMLTTLEAAYMSKKAG